MDDEFDKDEFDEFRNFNREELNRLFKERMEDEEFRRKFMGIVGGYQRDFEGIMKILGATGNPFNNPFSGMSSDSGNTFLNGMDFSRAFNEDGWIDEHWSSPDGETHISSFTRSMTPEEFHNMDRHNRGKVRETTTEDVILDLEDRMVEALLSDTSKGYKEAASLRDQIKSLKEGEKTENENKTKEK